MRDAPRPGLWRWLGEMIAVLALALLWLSLAGLATKAAPPLDLVAGLGVLAAFVLMQIAPARRLGWRIAALLGWPGWRALAGGIAAALIALAAELVWVAPHFSADAAGDSGFAFGRATLAVLLFPPIEELAFRGWLQQSGEQRLPPALAMLIPALLFAALHSSGDWLPRIGGGLVLGAALLATRSLWVPLAMHVTVNLVAVLASRSEWINASIGAVGRHPPAWLAPTAWMLNIAVAIAALATAVLVSKRRNLSAAGAASASL